LNEMGSILTKAKMKGTIDQVEAFVEGISSAWGRSLTFLGCICIGHLMGVFASDLLWSEGELHSGFELILVPVAPLTWLWAFLTSFLDPWRGLILLVVVGTAFFLLVYTDTPRIPVACSVAIVQSWITYAVFAPSMRRPDPWTALLSDRDPPAITWLGTPFLTIATLVLGYLTVVFWRRARQA
jgi:hypothetical protein